MGLKRRLIAGTINRYPAEDGWMNVHLDGSDRGLHPDGQPPEIVAELGRALDIPGESFDEVRCWQTLEHLHRPAASVALSEFFRILKPGGGCADIETPDIDQIARLYVDGTIDIDAFLQNVYGEQFAAGHYQDGDLMTHRWGWTGETLTRAMADAGFCNIYRAESGALRYRGYKP